MKKVLVFVTIVVLIAACSSPGYKVSGTIEGLTGKVIMTTLNSDGDFVAVDSADVTDGTFIFSGKVPAPQEARLTLDGRRGPQFFLENSAITLKAQLDSMQRVQDMEVTGSVCEDIMAGLADKMAATNEEMSALNPAWREASQAKDEAKMNEIRAKAEEISNRQTEIQKAFAVENASNPVGPYMVYRRLRYQLSVDEMKEYAAKFGGSAKKTVYSRMLDKTISVLEAVAIGKVAPEFEMENPEGEMIKLSSFRGKYLLIDFWASWCGPCRRENPNVVKLYNEVAGKGFEILGVSLDRTREAWLKGIAEDKLTWSHVSDLKFWDNRVAKLYGVSSIPHTVLLDKEGVIIAKNLRGEDLRNKVLELVN